MTVHPLRPPVSRARRHVRTAVVTALALVSVLVFIVLTLALFGHPEALLTAHQRMRAAKPWLVLFQLATIAALWLGWPWLVDRLGTRWPDEARAALLAARHRICIGLLLVELVVVLGIPFNFL